jgi:hypothetical protein
MATKLFQTTQHPIHMHTMTTAMPSTGTTAPITLFVGFIALPKLTQPEKDLLDQHQGCYKCQVFYTGHFSCTCSNERPTLEECKKVTTMHALCAKAIFGADMHEDYIDEDFMDSDEFNEYVDPLPTLLLPEHFWWNCCIDAPFTCAPSLIRVLIDHGAFPVLISEDTVELYSLIPHKLFKPFAVSTTFVSGQPRAELYFYHNTVD